MNQPVSQTSPERRNQARKLIRLAAELETAGGAPMPVRTVEVSMGGAALASSVNLKPGQSCRISIALPARPPQPMLDLRGTITYSVLSQRDGGFRVGVQFQALSSAAQARLQAFMAA